MNAVSSSQARLVIVGTTGMVGGYALHNALEHPTTGPVAAIGRRSIGIAHAPHAHGRPYILAAGAIRLCAPP
jgi:hypothetical protein